MASMAGGPMNPYAPPKSDWVDAPNPAALMPQQWWFEGETLVVLRSGSLPTDLCVKTGQPTQLPPVQRTLQWVHPLVAISVISPIIFIILYFIFRKTAKLTYAISPEFVSRRRTGLALIFAPLGLFALALFSENGALIAVSLLAFLVGLIAGLRMTMPFQIRKIDKERIYLKIDDRFRQALVARG
jgi:hypothetical protein